MCYANALALCRLDRRKSDSTSTRYCDGSNIGPSVLRFVPSLPPADRTLKLSMRRRALGNDDNGIIQDSDRIHICYRTSLQGTGWIDENHPRCDGPAGPASNAGGVQLEAIASWIYGDFK